MIVHVRKYICIPAWCINTISLFALFSHFKQSFISAKYPCNHLFIDDGLDFLYNHVEQINRIFLGFDHRPTESATAIQPSIVPLTIFTKPERKWPPFWRRHIQIHFWNQNLRILIKMLLKFVRSICSDHGLALNMRQAIIWTNDGIVYGYLCIYMRYSASMNYAVLKKAILSTHDINCHTIT